MSDQERELARLRAQLGLTGQKAAPTRQICVRGARGILRVITCGEGGKPIGERIIDEAEYARLFGDDEERGRRNVRANALHTAAWRMEHWPEEYPDMAAALEKGRAQDNIHDTDDRLWDGAYDGLIAEAGP